MIDQLRMMAIFQAVAELGSFRSAAKRLNLSPSVVSYHVSQLEEQLGMPLLYRSTRRISLTDAGADLLRSSQRMSEAALEGLAAVKKRKTQPIGKLSLTVPTSVAHRPFSDLYVQFARTYPKVELNINVTDQIVALEGSQFDVAIRGSSRDLDDSSYKARSIGRQKFFVFTTPQYAATRPQPTRFEDLKDWDHIAFPPIPWKWRTALANGTEVNFEPKTIVSTDNYTMARRFLNDGLGFMIENYPLMAEDIRAGKIIQILPEIEFKSIEVHAIYPANVPPDSLAVLFVEFMQEQIRANGYGFEL